MERRTLLRGPRWAAPKEEIGVVTKIVDTRHAFLYSLGERNRTGLGSGREHIIQSLVFESLLFEHKYTKLRLRVMHNRR